MLSNVVNKQTLQCCKGPENKQYCFTVSYKDGYCTVRRVDYIIFWDHDEEHQKRDSQKREEKDNSNWKNQSNRLSTCIGNIQQSMYNHWMRYKVIRAIKSTNPTISCLNTLQDDMELTSRNLLISGATNRNTSPTTKNQVTTSSWNIYKSCYWKLRISSNEIKKILLDIGFTIDKLQMNNGFITIIASTYTT